MSAYLPPTTAAARMGSVGVRQAAMARQERKERPGMSTKMRLAETNQPWRRVVDKYETDGTNHLTHPGHDGNEEEEETAPVLFHVLFGELNTNGKHADCKDNAGYFKGDGVQILRV